MSIKIGDININHINEDAETFLHKSIILFGQSGTGKTVLVKHILNILKDIVPICLAFVPTEDPESPDSYSKIIYSRCVHTDMSRAADKMKKIWTRQSEGRPIMSLNSDFNKLKALYERNRIDKIDLKIRQMTNIVNEHIAKVKSNPDISDEEKSNIISQITTKLNNNIKINYKQGIAMYKDEMMSRNIEERKKPITEQNYNNLLSDTEIKLLKYLNYNNNIIIIFDDCMAEIQKWAKEEEIKKIFFQGRHYNITTMFVMHSDKGFPPDLRANAFINIFTTSAVATNYFNTKNNPIDKKYIKLIPNIIEEIFKQPEDPKAPRNYRKLVFMSREPTPIKFIIAKKLTSFQFGGQGLNKLKDCIDDAAENQIRIRPNTIFT